MHYKVIYVMGVSGSGKSTIGEQLAAKTGFAFYDADNFHTEKNKAKMNAGIPLTDDDRWPWLQNIHDFVTEQIKSQNIILVCSALKQVYRDFLSRSIEENCRWVFLKGSYDTIMLRMQSRKGHFMNPALLQSQFDALEVPETAVIIDIKDPPEVILTQIISAI